MEGNFMKSAHFEFVRESESLSGVVLSTSQKAVLNSKINNSKSMLHSLQ
jgi:hypothetical protein